MKKNSQIIYSDRKPMEIVIKYEVSSISIFNLFTILKLIYFFDAIEKTERLTEKYRKRIGHFVAKMISKPVVMADTNRREYNFRDPILVK